MMGYSYILLGIIGGIHTSHPGFQDRILQDFKMIKNQIKTNLAGYRPLEDPI